MQIKVMKLYFNTAQLFLCLYNINEIDSISCFTNDLNNVITNVTCYGLFKTKLRWSEAQEHCRHNFHNGTLAEPRTQDELKAIYHFVNYDYTTDAWIGANRSRPDVNFQWASDNSDMSLHSWAHNQPDHPFTEHCLQTYGIPYLNNAPCGQPYSFVCQTSECHALFPGITETLLFSNKCSNKTWTYHQSEDVLLYFKRTDINICNLGTNETTVAMTNSEESLTEEVLDNEEMIKEIIQSLQIDVHNLSSYRRHRISAPDTRLSAQACGGVGVVLISVVFTVFLLSDLMRFLTKQSARQDKRT